ncbi:hypothetical protein BH09GEM1_BH09GEM1_14120 [soil metagenome]
MLIASQVHAQGSLPDRIGRVRDGVVRLQYESRPGVCGDGKSMVSYHSAMFARDFSGFGTRSDAHCVSGPVRVSLVMLGGRMTQSQTQIGGAWPSLGSPVTDMGVVGATEAASYFFAHVGEMESINSRDRLPLPAVVADANVMAPLLAVARDDQRHLRTRRQEHAIFVISQRDDDASVNALMKIARDDADTKKRSKALFWLAQKHDPRATKLIGELVLK